MYALTGVYVDSPTDFLVDARAITRQGDNADNSHVTCTITNPSGAKTEKLVTSMVDGTYRVSYTPFEEGCHTIDIFYDNIPIPGSPFIVNVRRGCDAKRCRAFGPGLEQGFVDKANVFTVETKGKSSNHIQELLCLHVRSSIHTLFKTILHHLFLSFAHTFLYIVRFKALSRNDF